MDYQLETIDSLLNAAFLVTFIISILLVGMATRRLPSTGVFGVVRSASTADFSLGEFLHSRAETGSRRREFAFQEEYVASLGRRIHGRVDCAYLHMEEVPVLDLLVEMKFPLKLLPETVHAEDLFQASLYALALADSGVSCSHTRLEVIYCTQKQAEHCFGQGGRSCVTCRRARRFHRKFDYKSTVATLSRLDEVWYEGRKPKPIARPEQCRRCPYSHDGACNYASA